MYFRDMPVRRKLAAMMLIAAGAAVMVMAMAWVALDRSLIENEAKRVMRSEARLIAGASQAALAFNDTHLLEDMMRKFQTSSHVDAAYVLKADGSVFVSSLHPGRHAVPAADMRQSGSFFMDGRLIVNVPVVLPDGERLGMVSLCSNLNIVRHTQQTSLIAALVVFVFSMLMALILSGRLHRGISTPLERLLKTIQRVSKEGDFSLRATGRSADEIGQLIGGFNEMLEALQQRDGELARYQAHLEALVEERAGEVLRVNEQLKTELCTVQQQQAELDKLSLAIEQMDESMVITDADGNIEYANPAFSRLTGCKAEDVEERNFAELGCVLCDQAITSGMQWQGIAEIERDGDGVVNARSSVTPVRTGDGIARHFIVMMRDISHEMELEDQLRHAQKMEAVGTLAGGIAHDFNNMLAAMLGKIEIVRMKMAWNKDIDKMLADVDKTGYRAAAMIQKMLTFARKGRMIKKVVELAPLVRESFELACISLPDNIETHLDVKNGDLAVEVDATQIQQIMLNLMNNACDAMEDVAHPVIHVRLEECVADEGLLVRHPHMDGQRLACLSISDNGCGIPEHEMEKIFEPFYTTKEVGRGTGLGLSMAYGSVESHGGGIEVESQPGEGTSFHLFLPLNQVDEVQTEESPEGVKIRKGHGETILVADDEASVRATNRMLLEHLRYKVIEAGDGVEAMQIFEQQADQIDLVLLDMVMPRMGGIDAARLMRKINAQIPILMATGYDKTMSISEQWPAGRVDFLAKPYTCSQLSRVVYTLLKP